MVAFLVMAVGGVVQIQYSDAQIQSLPSNPYPGEPMVPVDIRRIVLPGNARNVRLIIDDLDLEEINSYQLNYNDTIVIAKSDGDSIIPLPRIPHPSPAVLEGFGQKRDSVIAVVRINPIYYDGSRLYKIRRIAFHLEWEELLGENIVPLPDSLDYLILTVSWLHPYVDSIAYLAKIRGLRTLVIDIDGIATNPKLIRDTIKYYYRNFGIRYASIVAHASIAHPYLLRFHPDSVLSWYYPTGPLVYTDFPFMALDGEYYESQDEFVGDGDDGTDMVPDIGFSRIPVSNIVELKDYYTKLKSHLLGENPSTPGSITCLESRLDVDTTSFAWFCESAVYGLGIPRIQRMYEPYFDYYLTREEFFDSLNALKPQFFIYIGHSNIDRILTTYLPRIDIFTSTYYALMDNFVIPFSYIGGCWPGDPLSAAMTVNLPRVDNKGSLFTMGASKLDYASNEAIKSRGILESFFILNKPFASDAVNYIRENYIGRRYFMYEIMTYGDPTLTIFKTNPTTPPAAFLFSNREIGIMTQEDSITLAIISSKGYERYVLMEGDTTIPLTYKEPDTLIISFWKPGYVPLIRKIYFVPDEVVFGKPFLDENAVAGDTIIVSIPVSNYTDKTLSYSLRLEAIDAYLLNDYIQGMLSPHTFDTLEISVIPLGKETFVLRYLYPDGKIESYRFPVINFIPSIVGVRWDSDSAQIDVYNPAPITAPLRITTLYQSMEYDLPSRRATRISIYAPDSTITVKLETPSFSVKKTLLREEGPPPPKTVKTFGMPSGIQLYMEELPPYTYAFRVYRRKIGDLLGYKHVGITSPGSLVFVDHPEDYGKYCYRVSSLDEFMNEGPLSEEICASPGPGYGFMKPISYAEQIYSQPVLGQFDRTTPSLELFLVGNVHMAFYNSSGTPYDGFPIQSMFEVRTKPIVVDYDNDGFEEAIVSGKSTLDNRSYLLAVGLDGIDTLYQSDYGYDFALSGGLLSADISGDSTPEIIFKTYYGTDPFVPRFIFMSGDSIMFQFSLNGDAFNYITPAATDIDADGKAEILFMDEDKKLYALNGDSSFVDGFPIDLSSDIPGTINYTEVLGIDTLILAISRTAEGEIYLSKLSLDGEYAGTIHIASGLVHYYWQHTSLGYINDDSIPDLLIPSRDSLIIVDIEGNRLAPSLYQYLMGPYTMSSPILADIGKDGEIDIIFSNASMIQVYRYINGSLEAYDGFPMVMADDSTMDSQGLFPPFVEDMDGNGYAELYVTMNRLGYIYQIESPPSRTVPWSQEFANKWNTNWYNFEPPDVPVLDTEKPAISVPAVSFSPGFILLEGKPGIPYELTIFNVAGRKIKSFKGTIHSSGENRLYLNLPDGIYILRATIGHSSIIKKFIHVR